MREKLAVSSHQAKLALKVAKLWFMLSRAEAIRLSKSRAATFFRLRERHFRASGKVTLTKTPLSK